MAPAEAEDKPWRRVKEERLRQEQQAAQPAPLTDNQRDALDWYRNTCLVAGAGLIGSIWREVAGGAKQHQVFVPPRAQGLPAEVVDQWRRNMRFKEGVRSVGRQTVFVTGIGALYFGVEVAMRRWRHQRDALNTAAAGAVTGAYLGAIVPGAARGRAAAMGAAGGAALGLAAGWLQQQLLALAPPPRESTPQQMAGLGDQATSSASSSS